MIAITGKIFKICDRVVIIPLSLSHSHSCKLPWLRFMLRIVGGKSCTQYIFDTIYNTVQYSYEVNLYHAYHHQLHEFRAHTYMHEKYCWFAPFVVLGTRGMIYYMVCDLYTVLLYDTLTMPVHFNLYVLWSVCICVCVWMHSVMFHIFRTYFQCILQQVIKSIIYFIIWNVALYFNIYLN